MNSTSERDRRLAAVWFADIVGYTSLSAKDEDAALQIVGEFQRLAQEVVPQFQGRVVKYIGDAALAEFASVDGALRSALTLMERFNEDATVRQHGTTLRVGVNVGEVITAPDGDIYGDGVNLASRLQSQAAPGQVVASEAVHAQIRQRPVFRTEPLGAKAVKGISDPVRIYAVTLLEAGEGVVPVAAPVRLEPMPRKALPWIPIALAAVAVVVGIFLLPPLFAGRTILGPPTFPVVEGGLDVNGAITLTFSGEVDPATATSRHVRLMDASGGPVPAEVALGADKRSVTLDPLRPLAYGTGYTLVVSDSLLGADGDPVQGPQGGLGASFAIATQPVPAGGPRPTVRVAEGFDADRADQRGPIPLRFSEPVDPATASAGGIRMAGSDGGEVSVTLLFTDENREVRVEPTSALSAGASYVVRIDSTVTSATGVAVTPDSVPFRVVPRTALATGAAEAPRPQTAASSGGAPAPAGGTGPASLALDIQPDAGRPFVKVVVDGDTLGPPPVSGVSLAPEQPHTIVVVGTPELSAHSITVFERTVTPTPGEAVRIEARIIPFGSIDVVSEPRGIVFINGRQVGRTPVAGIPVMAGRVHRIEIRPLPADARRVGVFTGEFRVAPFEWKSLGRVTLPPRG